MTRRGVSFLIFCLGLSAALLLDRTAPFRAWENRTLDSRFRWRHRIMGAAPSPEIRLVGIDDQTLLALGGRWPIDRHWHALLLEALSERPPAVTAYSVLFPADPGAPEEEAVLVQATRQLGDVVYPYYLEYGDAAAEGPSPYRSPEEIEADRTTLARFALAVVRGDASLLPGTIDAVLPFEPLAASAALGFANAGGDPGDGVVRRVPLVLALDGEFYPSFILMAALRFFNADARDVRVALGRRVEFDVPGGPRVSIPVDGAGMMLVNYAAEHTEFEHCLFVQAVQSFAIERKGLPPPVDLGDLEGRLVLVGLTAAGVVESAAQPTPLSPQSPLLTAQANALSTILSGSFVRVPGPWATLGFLALLGAAVGVTASSLRAAPSLALAAAWTAAYVAAAYVAFFARSLVLPVVPGCFLAGLLFTLTTSYRYATEERQRRFYRGVLGRYLSPNVMEAILDDPSALRLGGERREMTVLFADVVGFSGFCERSPVEEVVPRLNELHDRLTQIIWRHDGTLDKYIGDGLMAFWGAPLPQADHARRAVRAAVEMAEELRRMRGAWEARGVEPFRVGIGVNTGTMIVGNMGASDFWDYTVIGDEVNLAARLEALTRAHGADVILSESTFLRVRDMVEARPLGEVVVKGRRTPVRIHAVVGAR
ncbi:MAG: adenylate/guanylate cyclase domain-containing protein [bacterium]|nr:adenylate/guanylate cyclase domain-containing protein [bacterium]